MRYNKITAAENTTTEETKMWIEYNGEKTNINTVPTAFLIECANRLNDCSERHLRLLEEIEFRDRNPRYHK